METGSHIELFVPGRICLFGEHSDWAGGFRTQNACIPVGQTIICGTNAGIYARASAHRDHLVLHSELNGERVSAEISTDLDSLLAVAEEGGIWSYVAGVAYQIRKAYDVGGLAIDNYKTDLPVAKGLSSSAAVSVLTARAFNWVYDLGMTVQDEMEFAYLGEITTPSQCGRMDQGCAFGQVPIQMSFDGEALGVMPLGVGNDIHLVLVDLGASKSTKRILDDLQACYPVADTETAMGLHELLGATNQRIIRKAVKCLAVGDSRRLGQLMSEAQSLFDTFAQPACPSELASPVLHGLLDDERVAPFVWGGKGVGSQGDGSAQFVARSRADQMALVDLIGTEFGMHAMPLTIRPSTNQAVMPVSIAEAA